MKDYRRIDGIELNLRERLLTYVAQEISPYQSCTYLGKLCELTGVDRDQVGNALRRLEDKWIFWARAGSLHNIHLMDRQRYQQHPIQIVRAYRQYNECRIKGLVKEG